MSMEENSSLDQKVVVEPNVKPRISQRIAGGLIDTCLIFLFFWLCYYICLSTPITSTIKAYRHDIMEIQDTAKLDSGYGEKVTITEENQKEYSNYITYSETDPETTVTTNYVVVNKTDATQEVYDTYVSLLKENKEYSNLNFDYKLMNYGINVLCGFISLTTFLLVIPLCNQRRATIGQLCAEEQLFSTRYQGRARWYHVLIRYLFIFFIDGCLPYLFFGLYTFVAIPLIFLIISCLTKSGRTLHCLCSMTKVIDKKSYTPMVEDDDLNANIEECDGEIKRGN